MERDDLLTEVKLAFGPELQEGSLTVLANEYHAEAFGNAYVVLEGIGFRLKVRRERSEQHALIAPGCEPEEWDRLQAAVTAVSGDHVPGAIEVDWELSPSDAAALFRRHHAALASGYKGWWGWRSTRRKLRQLGKEQQKCIDEWLSSPKDVKFRDLDAEADRELENPSEELQTALRSLGPDSGSEPGDGSRD